MFALIPHWHSQNDRGIMQMLNKIPWKRVEKAASLPLSKSKAKLKINKECFSSINNLSFEIKPQKQKFKLLLNKQQCFASLQIHKNQESAIEFALNFCGFNLFIINLTAIIKWKTLVNNDEYYRWRMGIEEWKKKMKIATSFYSDFAILIK